MDLVDKYLTEKVKYKVGEPVVYQSSQKGLEGGTATVRMEFRGAASYSYTVDVEFPGFKHAPIHKTFKTDKEAEKYVKKQLGKYKLMYTGSLSK